MTEQTIQQILKSYNTPNKKIHISSHPIGGQVDYGVVWIDNDFNKLGDVSPYRFYFINNDKGICIAGVLDMNQDLHWFVNPKARGKGYLGKALTAVILPHLSKKRKEQRITINRDEIGDENFEASLNVAKRAGFRLPGVMDGKIECHMKLAKFKKIALHETVRGMDYEQMELQRKKMNVVVGNLWQIKAEVEIKLGTSKYTRELARTIEKLELYRGLRLDDAVYDFEQKQKRKKI